MIESKGKKIERGRKITNYWEGDKKKGRRMERESEDNNYREEAKRTTEGGNQAERKTDGGGRGNITSRVEASRSQVQAKLIRYC